MILDVAGVVARHCQIAEAEARTFTVAFINTTDPVFLIFSPGQAHPRFVAKAGAPADLERRVAMEARLHALLPTATAKPWGVAVLDASRGVTVHGGLPGAPWYRLADQLASTADWVSLRGRCIAQLRAFEAAVASEPGWVEPARPGERFRAVASDVGAAIAPLGAAVEAWMRAAAAELDALGTVPVTWQHGDFVLNNLLVDDDRLGIVDLVDFGAWRLPMLDACALACSFHLHAGHHVPWHPVADDLAAAMAGSPYSPQQKSALFALFLLAAIADTQHRPNREGVRRHYLALLDATAADVAGLTSRLG